MLYHCGKKMMHKYIYICMYIYIYYVYAKNQHTHAYVEHSIYGISSIQSTTMHEKNDV